MKLRDGLIETLSQVSKELQTCGVRICADAIDEAIQIISQLDGVVLTKDEHDWLEAHLTLLWSMGLTDQKEVWLCNSILAKLAQPVEQAKTNNDSLIKKLQLAEECLERLLCDYHPDAIVDIETTLAQIKGVEEKGNE